MNRNRGHFFSFRLLRRFCPPHLLEEIEGDLLQKYERDVKAVGEKKANRTLLWNAIRFFRPGILFRNENSSQLKYAAMFSNYFKVMMRGISRQKFNTATNVIGLTVGLTFTLLIGVFIAGELEVNQSLKDVDQLFIVNNNIVGQPDNIEFFTPPVLGKRAVEQYPLQFNEYYRFWDRNITVSKGDKHFRIQSMIGDSSFLHIFGFQVLYGDARTALGEPNSAIVTEDVAQKFFGRTDVVNETLSISTELNGIKEYTITAIIQEPADKNVVSDLMNMNAQIFLSFENRLDFLAQSDPNTWQDGAITYVKLNKGLEKTAGEKILNELLHKEAPPQVVENRTLELIPVSDYYMVTNHGAVKKLLISLSIIAVFILILAVTNFINIAMASSMTRLKEVGVRKVIGGLRSQLVVQFLSESIIMALGSGVLALVLYQILCPIFNTLLGANLPAVIDFKPVFWLVFAVGVLLIGFLAGIYPALFQSATRPVESLKGKSKSVRGTLSFSRVLITTQFVITTFIFIGALVLSNQTVFFLERDLGFNQSHVLVVYSVPRWWGESGFQKMDAATTAFQQSGKVKAVGLSWGAPGWGMGGGPLNAIYKAGTSREQAIGGYVNNVDENFDDVYQLKVIDGEFLSKPVVTWNPGQVVLNESASKKLGVRVGDKIHIDIFDSLALTVRGIVADFHYESKHEAVKPLVLVHNRDSRNYRYFSFRMEAGSPANSLTEVVKLWKDVFPGEAFSCVFADDKLQELYTTELQLKKAAQVATGLMLIIVLTGLLGLVALNMSKRVKEIGIRKALGATALNILSLVSRDYARLLMLAVALAIPLSWYFTNQWLQNYAYHIELTWPLFAMPVFVIVVITLLVVIAQSLGTALTNPVKSLRHE